MRITATLEIDEDELIERFVRASGPGGQNVNKVATAVEVRFDVSENTSIPTYARAKLKRLAGRRMTAEGILVIQADRFRSQDQNRADARARMKELIAEAMVREKPRIATKPSRASKERRIKEKSSRGQVKKLRSRKVDLD
jgi:ribosome-associated protein